VIYPHCETVVQLGTVELTNYFKRHKPSRACKENKEKKVARSSHNNPGQSTLCQEEPQPLGCLPLLKNYLSSDLKASDYIASPHASIVWRREEETNEGKMFDVLKARSGQYESHVIFLYLDVYSHA